MIGTSMIAMFFLMYLNSYQILDHAWFSETRLFMTLIMGAAMMAVMLGFMLGMYEKRKANVAIFLGAGVLLLAALWLVRSQGVCLQVLDRYREDLAAGGIVTVQPGRVRLRPGGCGS